MQLDLRYDHPWDVTTERARSIQEWLAPLVSSVPLPAPVRTIAGIDVSFPQRDLARAAIVVIAFPEQEPVEQATVELPISFPYIPGLLSFREIPVVLESMRRLNEMPDVLMCDAQGQAHPRRFGLASHLGVLLDCPSIGCAKSKLTGRHSPPGEEKGNSTWLYDRDEIIGAVVRTRTRVRPVYVSVGHKIDLGTATRLVLASALKYRLPEPTRLAHLVAGGAQLVTQGARS